MLAVLHGDGVLLVLKSYSFNMLLYKATVLAAAAFHFVSSRPTDNIIDVLGPRLSPGASISTNTSTAPRWSDYHAPEAGVIVHVADKEDVVETVC